MRRVLLCLVLVAALLLGGCMGSPIAGGPVEDLLRAPQPTQQLSAVQKALGSYLGETIQLKYPRGGTEMSPILFADLDGDDANEAVAMYTAESKGQNVHLAVMENTGDGWEVTYEIEGMSTEVASLQLARLVTGGTQLIVGYANATLTDKYLTVYDYHNDTVQRLFEQSYVYYLASDVNGNAISDLVVAANGAQAGALTLQWLAAQDGALAMVQTMTLDERFVTCQRLYTVNSDGLRGLIAEGTFASGWLANEVFVLQPESKFVRWPQNDTDVPMLSLRSLTGLTASVLETGGVLRVPTNVTTVTTLSYSRRFYLVTWQDYLNADEYPVQTPVDTGVVQPEANAQQPAITRPEQPYFGVYDSLYGYFVRLPDEWHGQVTIADGAAKGDWQVRRREGNLPLISVRVAAADKPTGTYVRVAGVGTNNILIYFSNQCTASEIRRVRSGVSVLQP